MADGGVDSMDVLEEYSQRRQLHIAKALVHARPIARTSYDSGRNNTSGPTAEP